jgi:MoaA/NifB/PqqE/SkfB family radical SAM enzyme
MESFYNTVKVIQFEHSSLCNAACPQCLREWWGGDHSRIKQTFIPTEFYENRIPDHVYQNLQTINFCGTVGDPCTAPNIVDVIKVIKRKNPNIQIIISTNGGMRKPEFWKALGSTLNDRDAVIFGIDGLEDTNWIYRVNVKWNALIDNVKAYISTGARAEWQYIVFKHNEHQVNAAEEFSQELGFKRFFTIYNNRFVVEEAFGQRAKGADGKLLEPPTQKIDISPLLRREKEMPKEPLEWYASAEKQCIKCQAKSLDEAYIDAETHLFPCCYLAGAKFTLDPLDKYDGYYDHWIKHGGDKIKLSLHSWDEILTSDYYAELEKSWNKKFGEGRLLVCSGVCSTDDVQFSIYKNEK